MSGSDSLFAGTLLITIKDVVDAAADEAVTDFTSHIERIAANSELVVTDDGQMQSTFFIQRMYQSGWEIIPYPPLATESFFIELNECMENAINETKIMHNGGRDFLDHMKLVMAKLNICDWSSMSNEHAKMRILYIKETLQNAIIGGAIVEPPPDTKYGVTFDVADDENLLLLDSNKVLTVDWICRTKEYDEIVTECLKNVNDKNVRTMLMDLIGSINDAGLMLGKTDSLTFLWNQFRIKIKRTHDNFKSITNMFQNFLYFIYQRRKFRVNTFIMQNMSKFEAKCPNEIEALKQSADSQFTVLRHKLKICFEKCGECFYPCLLHKNHNKLNDGRHDCRQMRHGCKELCEFCLEEGNTLECGARCGHSGRHNCHQQSHTCGNPCSLSKYVQCQMTCNLEPKHDGSISCKCAAETHYCIEQCSVDICKSTCKIPYNVSHTKHVCIELKCPYKCQVICWNNSERSICGNPCSSSDHCHHSKMQNGECKDENHFCDREHLCPEDCNEEGNCKVEVQRKYKKETLITQVGSEIEYNSFAEVNAGKKRCCKKIAVGKFKHDGNEHRCYGSDSGKLEHNIHTCTERCDSCGYFCELPFGHGGQHHCFHGNMRNTVFYSTEETVDTGDHRKYKHGDVGDAELCNKFCERLGRGHVHLELCSYSPENADCFPDRIVEEKKDDTCAELEGIRHEKRKYKPNPEHPKDEVQHYKYWSRKNWKDPCLPIKQDDFKKCDYACQHPKHSDPNDTDKQKRYCTKELWHNPLKDTATGHKFGCHHPFSKAHIIGIIDISSSMSTNDKSKSVPQFKFIKDVKNLNNRLGAAYSSIQNLLETRINNQCTDLISVVVFNGSATVAAQREFADVNFVKNNLLQYKPYGSTCFYEAFKTASTLMNGNDEYVVIFLTDGYAKDNGSSDIVRNLRDNLGKRFRLFCITFGPEANKENETVTKICNAGGGKMKCAIDGTELGTAFISIAKQMNTGTFGRL
eukprot:46451_1